MREIEEKELTDLIETPGQGVAVYLYTPLCGTCQVARRMLEVAELLLPVGTLVAVNVNMARNWVQEHQISSVPALYIVDAARSQPPVIRYRMGSVEELLSEIRGVIS